jgi:RNA-directed DNA polymerase
MEVCEMQNADILFAVMRARGEKGQPVERLYRLLFNQELYLRAYAKLYPNKGSMTPGATPETIDEMSLKKIDSIIEAIKCERYQWTPVRRTYIKKANGKLRPLGLPTLTDRLVQMMMKVILEPIFESDFYPSSHGFRPQMSCHTALAYLHQQTSPKQKKMNWVIEGDIVGCFDHIQHKTLIHLLRRRIQGKKLLLMVWQMLKAGVIENQLFKRTPEGTPQGGLSYRLYWQISTSMR